MHGQDSCQDEKKIIPYQSRKIFSHTGDVGSEEWSVVMQSDNYCQYLPTTDE
jgi:hypothetical protein